MSDTALKELSLSYSLGESADWKNGEFSKLNGTLTFCVPATILGTDPTERAAIAARAPSEDDLDLIAIPPPPEWRNERSWK